MNNLINTLKIVGLAVILSFGLSAVYAATATYTWKNPSYAPLEGNVAAPLNVGNVAQVKDGSLGMETLLADQICLGNPPVCITSWPSAPASAPVVTHGVQSYSTSGSYLWTAPSGITSIFLTMKGAGGGGGGGGGGGSNPAGEGGNGGLEGLPYPRSSVAVTPGVVYLITVGQGGAGGAAAVGGNAGGAGGQGSATSFKANDVAVAFAPITIPGSMGGAGGKRDANASGATGADMTYVVSYTYGNVTVHCNCKGEKGLGFFGGAGGLGLTSIGLFAPPYPSAAGGSGTQGGGGGGGGAGGAVDTGLTTFVSTAGKGGKGSDGSVLIEW